MENITGDENVQKPKKKSSKGSDVIKCKEFLHNYGVRPPQAFIITKKFGDREMSLEEWIDLCTNSGISLRKN